MKLSSTRNSRLSATYEDAVFNGLAPDGGLYQLSEPAMLKQLFQTFGSMTSFLNIASDLTSALLQDELGDATDKICSDAFSFAPELTSLEDGIDLLELYHGPSHAFKDFGASFLALSMTHLLDRSDRKAVILTATSGDTGSAVAQAFKGRDRIDVVILYPSGRVSPLQEKQLTTVGGNVHAIEVDGSFDDCQKMVKQAFLDTDLRAVLPLTSANSISIGRLLPQSFYYLYAASRYRDSGNRITFCVPSGNFGNLTAGVMGWQWGMECGGFIAATNANDVVPEYIRSSVFSPRPSVKTYSNAMDVGDPSNFERLLAIFNGDHDRLTDTIFGAVVTDSETLVEMRKVYDGTGKFICPHTAVGTLAARRYLADHPGEHIVALSTAHPAKFGEVIQAATGMVPELPPRLAEAMSKEKRAVGIENSLEGLRGFLMGMVG